MLSELRQLDIETLTQMYFLETDRLRQAVINGAAWEDVQQQRHRLIDVEVALYQKKRFQPPASDLRRIAGRA
jgi:hypothetical protein